MKNSNAILDVEAFETWKRRYAHKQTNAEGLKENLWYAYIPLRHGNNSTDFFAEVAEYLGNYGNDVIRFTKKEQIQVRNIPETYLPNIYQFFKKLGVYQIDYPVVVTNLTCCTGADTCRLGICLPKEAIDTIAKQLLASDLDLDAIPDFELRMNGCTNICAVATWADLGFSGRVGRVGDNPYPAYTVWLPVKGKHELDLQQGYIAAKLIPPFVEDYLRDVIAEQAHYADYYDYVAKRGKDIAKELLAKYKAIPPFEEKPDTFFDWGDDTKFSLIKYGKAECSAGLFDIIEIDQDTIREKLNEIEKLTDSEKIEKLLHDVVFSENRMLLVTRGLDPRTDEDVYDGFVKEFIDAGIVPQKYLTLTNKARNNQPLISEKALIEELASLLNDLYNNMDDSLQFKVAKEEKASEKAVDTPKNTSEEAIEQEVKTNGMEPNVKKDLRGVLCPMNFVKTKIALTPMKSGELLEVLLDDGAPIENVPGSVKGEGHTIVSTEKVENYWKVLIRKK